MVNRFFLSCNAQRCFDRVIKAYYIMKSNTLTIIVLIVLINIIVSTLLQIYVDYNMEDVSLFISTIVSAILSCAISAVIVVDMPD